MIQDQKNSNHWIADEGKMLKSEDTYAKEIWLGIYDSIQNWEEVDELPNDIIENNFNINY